MDEMVRYIFKSMKYYDKGFAAVAKFLKTQNKINKLVTINLGLFCVMHAIAYSDIKNLYVRVAELEREKNQNKGA